jgi:hypothetical protein
MGGGYLCRLPLTSGAKAQVKLSFNGTTEVVPFPKSFSTSLGFAFAWRTPSASLRVIYVRL